MFCVLAQTLLMELERNCLKYKDRHFYLYWHNNKDSQFTITHSQIVFNNSITHHERALEVTDLFSVEISILVTVGYGDCEEIIMRAGIRRQSVQCPL